MSSQGIITILLTVCGFLIVSWFALAYGWIMDRFKRQDRQFKEHDQRLERLEKKDMLVNDQCGEILDILRNEGGV